MCFGDDESRSEGSAASHEIDVALKRYEKELRKEVKLLLLGAGDSGKSTILKQMRLIHAAGFSTKDREAARPIIFANLMAILDGILTAMDDFGYSLQDASNEAYLSVLVLGREIGPNESLPHEYLRPVKSIWADEAVQKTAARGGEFALLDNAAYFFSSLERLFSPGYLPTDQDILCARLKTTGISEEVFNTDQLTFRVLDVGGQRSERRKWIHCFENVQAILFLVAISGYDQCLTEDHTSNQMDEAIMLFEQICNSQWFLRTSIILFLNKIDIFKKRIKRSLIESYFPQYNGGASYEVASQFFRNLFVKLNRNPSKDIYTHFTNATDTDLLRITMISVQDMVMQSYLQKLML